MTEQREDQDREPADTSDRQWMTCGVGGIGTASFLADVGHEVPTALMASLVTGTLGAPTSALGLIEGISDGLAGAGRFVGGPLADDVGTPPRDHQRHRRPGLRQVRRDSPGNPRSRTIYYCAHGR